MSWWHTILPLGITVVAVFVPGAVLARCAGVRGLTLAAVSAPLTVTICAGTAIVAPRLGVPYTPVVVAIATVIVALLALALRVAVLLRRTDLSQARSWIRPGATRSTARDYPLVGDPRVTGILIGLVSLVLPLYIIGLRYVRGIGKPENISQTYDNIFHLNAVQTIISTGNGSSLTLGNLTPTSAGFYPAAWHDLVAVVAELTGASVPLAVNATNIVVAALVWPLACLFLVSRISGGRLLPMMLTGVLSAAFSAFPYLMIDFGVLYPNHLAIAMLPLAIGLVVDVLDVGSFRPESVLTSGLLLVLMLPGMALAHPSVVVALVAFVFPLVLAKLAQQLIRAARGSVPRRRAIVWAGLTVLYVVAGLAVWIVARPDPSTYTWQPVQTAAQAVGEILGAAPMFAPISWLMLVLIAIGLYSMLRQRRQWWIFGMFLVGSALFIVASSMPVGDVRSFWTGVWYTDNFRLAALLPIVTVPIVAIGAEFLVRHLVTDLRRLLERRAARQPVAPAGDRSRVLAGLQERPGIVYGSVSLALVLIIGVLGQNPSLEVRQDSLIARYAMTSTSPLLDSDERALLDQVDGLVPAGEQVLANPRTGGALVLALADRRTVTPHVAGQRSPAEQTIIDHWDEAAFNTTVCAAVRDENAYWALDFGSREVTAGQHPYPGLNHLEGTPGVRLAAEVGHARLYELTACRA
ncbi:hypothetical protein GCM10011512_12940 [Tersicoccus solisilvae]|uniref:Uncharacterized protein n=1 Tax=Tersicoccus solisilvae TaxID=1882339 RepID=A0ABQ1NXY8_9MICC|nr:DUF6541 family protein [Tersicoccus solisilvae]GGC87407.1 hypothetical protein GCM10011512_12940 [Tersicoccus solisilvae]